jgi:hypothetical protein
MKIRAQMYVEMRTPDSQAVLRKAEIDTIEFLMELYQTYSNSSTLWQLLKSVGYDAGARTALCMMVFN